MGLLWHGTVGAATEFGGVADLGKRDPLLELQAIELWKNQGNLSWIRTHHPLLTDLHINQVSVVTLGGRALPKDLREVYRHCRDRLTAPAGVRNAWEIWNEPDFHFVSDNPDRMAAALKAAYWGVKTTQPDSLVLMPSLAFNPSKYGRALADNNFYPYTDGYNFHYYGWAQDFRTSLEQHRRFLRDQGWQLPLWVTESGFFDLHQDRAGDPHELARQRAFHERAAIEAYVEGVDYYLPFILTPYLHGVMDLSLATSDLMPRPALEAYLFLARTLPTTAPLYRLRHAASHADVGVVLEESTNRWWTVLWSPVRHDEPLLPGEKRAEGDGIPPALRSETNDPTRTQFAFRFPFPANEVTVGLEKPSPWSPDDPSHRLVDAAANLHLHTPSRRFEIEGCEWIKLSEASESGTEHTLPPKKIQPSPVVLQILFHDERARADKISQTYRFPPESSVTAQLEVYNFSDAKESGEVCVSVPTNWSLEPFGSASGDRSKLPQFGCSWSFRATLDPGIKNSISLNLRMRPDAGATAEPQSSLSSRLRSELRVTWTGDDQTSDFVSVWLEPEPPTDPIMPERPLTGWISSPAHPGAWDVQTIENDTVRLVLREAPTNGTIPSVYLPLPKDVILHENDHLVGELGIAGDKSRARYRLNAITAERESFRFGEDALLSAGGTRLFLRIGDLGPTFWSRVNPDDYSIPSGRIRHLRLSALGLEPGDVIFVRNFGVLTSRR